MLSIEKAWHDALANGEIRIPRCNHCGAWNWYPLPVCPACQHADFSWQSVVLSGKLYSWTRVHRNFSGHDIEPIPYVVGIVDLTDAPGVRIPCRYGGDDHEGRNFEIGKMVSIAISGLESDPFLIFLQD